MDLNELELIGSPADRVVGLFTALATVPEMDPLGGFLSSLWFWPGESAIPRGNAAETPLTPFEFGSSLFLNPFDIMIVYGRKVDSTR